MSTGDHETETEASDQTETTAAEPVEKASCPWTSPSPTSALARNMSPWRFLVKRSSASSANRSAPWQREAVVPGFRPGHAPRSLVEKRFRKQVADQVKQTLLMAALEQLDEDYDLNPIAQPQLDLAAIVIPDEGPLNFELDVEVRPDFALPAYKALTVNRPVKTISEADVDDQLKRFLERHGSLVPKLDGGAEVGDYLTTDLTFVHADGRVLNEAKEVAVPAPARAPVPGR